MSFFWVSTIFALFLWSVTLGWIFFPELVLGMWALPTTSVAVSLGLRVAGLVLGWGVALFLARRQQASPVRRAISYGSATAGLAAAASGVYSLVLGVVGVGILIPVTIEVAAAAAFILAERQVGEVSPRR